MTDKKVEDLLNDDSFMRWIRENADPQEANYWEAWADRHPRNQRLLEECKTLLSMLDASEPSPPDPSVELKRFEQSIDRYENGKKQNNHIFRSRNKYAAIAAVILLIVTSIGVLYAIYPESSKTASPPVAVNEKKEFSTDYGEKIEFTLSDGSSIILNSNSELTYSSSQKTGGNIDVWLKGEAWFSIPRYKGKKKRFFNVHTEDGRIRVLGTQFAVNTYSGKTQAVLEEGTIEVQVKDQVQDSILTEYTMEPGSLARFSAGNNHLDVQRVNPVVYTSWINEKLVFDNTPLAAVAQRIEDTYGVEVILRDESLHDERLSGSIQNKNLATLKKALAEALDEDVTQQDQTVWVGSSN